MSAPPPLFDRVALARHRARADSDALFLHHAAVRDLDDRLEMVNRSFRAAAVVSPFSEIWRPRLPQARIVPDEDTLDLQVGAHDLVVHAMCLHWANDPVGQLVQCRRALQPDGLCLTILLGGETLNELRACMSDAEIQVSGGLSPRVSPMSELRDIGGLLQRAGFALPVADSQTLTAHYRSARHLMQDLRAMGEANAMHDRLRHPTRRAVIDRAIDLYDQRHATAQGDVPATFEILTLTGWAPADTQPKPLRPGSAQTRLADALNTDETPLLD